MAKVFPVETRASEERADRGVILSPIVPNGHAFIQNVDVFIVSCHQSFASSYTNSHCRFGRSRKRKRRNTCCNRRLRFRLRRSKWDSCTEDVYQRTSAAGWYTAPEPPGLNTD